MANSNFHYHSLTEQHIDGALQLCRLAGWNQLTYDWQRLIRLEPDGCFGISSNSQLIGTVTNTRYGNNLAWIGMMLVHPDFRRMGLATELITACLNYLRDKRTHCVKLDATPTGQKVYERLGFEVEWSFNRWVLNPEHPQDITTPETCPSTGPSIGATAADFSVATLRLDEKAFGADRSDLIQDLATGTRWQFESDAYGLLRKGHLADYLGPVVAESSADARNIICPLIGSSDRTIFWDIPAPNDAAISLARSLGFEPTRVLIRMQTRTQRPAPNYQQQYAMFDPSVG